MKKGTRRRKAKATAKLQTAEGETPHQNENARQIQEEETPYQNENARQIQEEETPQQKENQGHRVCCSDTNEPESKFANSDSERAASFNKYELKYFESELGVHRSIVSLAAITDGWSMCCAGTVVDHVGKQTWILTSATLVRKPDSEFVAYGNEDIKIEVVLHNRQTVEGSLEMCNLHYNIALVTIEYPDSRVHLPAVKLSDLPVYYSLQPRPVFALGRDVNSKSFLVRRGELVRKNCELDCMELLVCLCDVSQDFIGGPIMDSQERFLGIAHSFEETAPFLPVEIAARCMKYFKMKRTLPWLRIRGQAVHTLDLDVLETICCKFARPPSGLLVNKICDTSTENCGGIKVGDIISKVDGVALYSVAQFTAIILDKLEVAMSTLDTVTVQVAVDRPKDQTTFVAKLNVRQVISDESNKSFQKRWKGRRLYVFSKKGNRLL